MTEKNGADILRRRSLPIDQWHEMGQAGDMIPVTIPLAGDSMRPLIRRNRDKVTIIPLNRELQIGDIVLFQGGRSGMWCTGCTESAKDSFRRWETTA